MPDNTPDENPTEDNHYAGSQILGDTSYSIVGGTFYGDVTITFDGQDNSAQNQNQEQ
jgi:hypothetical protein